MNELYIFPNGWELKKLSELSILITDGVHNSPQYVDNGIPMLDSKHIDDHYNIDDSNPEKFISEETDNLLSKRCKPQKNDVLISSRGSIGKIAIVKEKQNFNIMGNIILIRSSDKLNVKFLTYSISNSLEKLQKISKGAAQKGLYLNQVRDFEIPLPSLSEQERIISKLDLLFQKIDKSIELHQKNIDEADTFIESVLDEVFGELEVEKNVSLKEITTKIGSGATPSGGEKSYKTEGISLIRSMNVHDYGFRFKNLAFIDDTQAKKLSNVTVETNDVLLNITGASVARCCIVDESILPARVNQHVSIIRLKNDMLPRFLHYYLISPSIKSDLLFGSSGGATREAITKSMIEGFTVPLPPLSVQHKIINYLDSISGKMEKVKTIQKEKMDSLKALKASILDKAFRGEL